MTNRMSALTPIFDQEKRYGKVATVNGPPGILYDYDYILLTDVGAIWFSPLSPASAPVWPTVGEVITGNLADESEEGVIWFGAWYQESGEAPATYDLTVVVTELGAIWFSAVDQADAVVAGTEPNWPSLANIFAGNLGDESEWGRWWLKAWYQESGNAPADYDACVQESSMGTILFSALDTLDAATAAPDAPWTNATTTYNSGGRTYYEIDDVDGYFWSADPGGLTVDIVLIGGGASGGRSNSGSARSGGGGAGAYLISTSQAIAAGGKLVIAETVGGPGPQLQGTDGNATTFTLADGTIYEALGGSGGAGASNLAGKTGQGSGGGGGGNTVPSSGSGGAGSTGGNNGGDGNGDVSTANVAGGGGGGAGGVGAAGSGTGDGGDGGIGIEYPSGSGDWYCGGGAGAGGTTQGSGGSGVGGNPNNAGTPHTGSGGGAATISGIGGSSGRAIISHVT